MKIEFISYCLIAMWFLIVAFYNVYQYGKNETSTPIIEKVVEVKHYNPYKAAILLKSEMIVDDYYRDKIINFDETEMLLKPLARKLSDSILKSNAFKLEKFLVNEIHGELYKYEMSIHVLIDKRDGLNP